MMKKLLIAIVLMIVGLYGCGSGSGGSSATAGSLKPILHIVEEGGSKFLADESGVITHSLQAPFITNDYNNKVFVISPHVYYAPGTTYYGSFYDGFVVACGGHPRAGVEGMTKEFGSEGGSMLVPKSPYENCSFQAYVVDGAGTIFKTDVCAVHFLNQ